LISAVGITNQRETTVVWDRITGKPLYRAIVWLDTRTRETVQSCIQKSESKSVNHFKEKCGLPFSTYFSAVKLKWLLENVEAVKLARDEGRLMFGTIDTWLLYKFSGGKEGGVYYTDVTNASRTMLMNLKTLDWDSEICDFFEITKSSLPKIKSSSEVYASFKDQGFLDNVPIAGILGDQQAALVGQLCLKKGMLKNTYGTGCFMLCNTGTEPVQSAHGLLTTVGYKLGPDAPCYYALEGSIAVAGASVKWLRDNMGLISKASQVGIESDKVENSGGVYFVPAFSGLFAPHWRDDARGTIVGMTLATTKSHICRATLEAVSFQTKDIMDSMSKDMNDEVKLLRVDGGMSGSEQLMQIQADIAGVDLHRPAMFETTALGAALSAGLAVKVWDSLGTVLI
jgi:glycerol kinase